MSRTLNIEAEQAILGALLRWPDCLDNVGDTLREADFSNQAHRIIFAALERLLLAGKPVDAVSLHDAVNGGTTVHHVIPYEDIDYLSMLDVRRASVRRHAEIVRRASLERSMLSAVDQAAEIIDGDGELQERLERVTALFSGLVARHDAEGSAQPAGHRCRSHRPLHGPVSGREDHGLADPYPHPRSAAGGWFAAREGLCPRGTTQGREDRLRRADRPQRCAP
jgi:hypothetical protein